MMDKFQEPLSQPVEKFYFLNVSKVAYMRETLTPTPSGPFHDPSQRDTPDHRLVVYGLKVMAPKIIILFLCIV